MDEVKPDLQRTTDAAKVFSSTEATDAARKVRGVKTQDGFDNFASRIGLNNNNALSAGHYEFNLVTKNRVQLEAAYRGSWVVGVIIDAVADDMTRAGIDINTSEGDSDIPDMTSAFSRLQIWQSLCSVLKWSNLYGGSIGVMQIEGQDLATPLNLDTVDKGQFQGLAVYDRWQLNPELTEVIDSGPDIGLPKYYQIVTPATAGSATMTQASATSQRVHYSRCLRQIGIELPFFQAITEMMWGESKLERLWDRLIAFDNATMSSASLIDRANLRMVGIEGLREILAAGGEATNGLYAQFETMRLLQVNEGLTLLDKNDAYQSTAYSFAGLSEMLLQFGQQLSGACGIPLVRLFGQSPAGLSATGEADLRMYYDNINAQQNAKLRNSMEILLKVMWRSVFGKDAPKDLTFTFTPLWQMSALDKATIAKTNTETIIGATEAGLTTNVIAMKELRDMSGDTGLFSNITDEDIAEAEANPPPLPGEEDTPGEGAGGPPVPSATSNVKSLDAKPSAFRKIKKWLLEN